MECRWTPSAAWPGSAGCAWSKGCGRLTAEQQRPCCARRRSPTRRRREILRRATSGLRLDVAVTKDMYRPLWAVNTDEPSSRGIHAFDRAAVLPRRLALDTTLVVEALIENEEHHSECAAFLERLADE